MQTCDAHCCSAKMFMKSHQNFSKIYPNIFRFESYCWSMCSGRKVGPHQLLVLYLKILWIIINNEFLGVAGLKPTTCKTVLLKFGAFARLHLACFPRNIEICRNSLKKIVSSKIRLQIAFGPKVCIALKNSLRGAKKKSINVHVQVKGNLPHKWV